MRRARAVRAGVRWSHWWCALVLALVVAGCTTPAHRDFVEANQSTAPTAVQPIHEAPLFPVEPVEDLAPLLHAHLGRDRVPALAAAVIHGDRVIARGVAGVRRAGRNEPVTLENRFGIASCGKAMSAMLVAKLVESGALAWDAPIATYTGDVRVHDEWRSVTVRHLLNQRAGVHDPLGSFLVTTYTARGSLSERRWSFARRMLAAGPAAAPGRETRYSNASYILAAALTEHVVQQPWEELMIGYLRNDLGLTSAGYGPPGDPGAVTEPWGHGKRRLLHVGLLGAAAYDPGARSADYPAMASPAGYLHLTIDDWTRFVALHLQAHPRNPHRRTQNLDATTFNVLHTPEPGGDYAGGWYVSTRAWARGERAGDVGRVLYHLGNNGRWSSAAWIAPELDFAVLATCNRGDSLATIDRVVAELVGKYSRSPRPSLAAAAVR
ncbi:MAG TPA: serine hydrolase domain-containing protein [Candidatus Synoicihabitans sp.]|nr:serine hydrolase domain-containing protein [Candidatus Synoicihabitans sp.]